MNGSEMDDFIRQIESYEAQTERLYRQNGRMEFAASVQEWMIRNRSRLPAWVREELSQIIASAAQSESLH